MIEQSKKLLKLGLNPETSDMIHICSIIHGKENGFLDVVPKESILYAMHTTIEEKEKSIPCWSLGALLEVMPEQIIYSDFKPFPLGLFKGNKEEHSKYGHYWIQYFATDSGGAHIQTNGHSPIEAAYSMVVWLLENGYIKKESK